MSDPYDYESKDDTSDEIKIEDASPEFKAYRKTNDGWFDFYVDIKTGAKKFKLDDNDIEVNDLGQLTSIYWGVEQAHCGHIYRYVFRDDVLKNLLKQCNLLDNPKTSFVLRNGACEDILFPIGGSNSSATYFVECKNEKEVVAFLKSDVEVDLDDPMLVDLSEGIMDIELKEGCAKYFVDNNNISTETRWDKRYDDCKKMLDELKNAGYKDFDYDNPFYGKNDNMRYSELCDLYEKEVYGRDEEDIEIGE